MSQKLLFKYLIPVIYNILDTIPNISVYDGEVPPEAAASYIVLGERNAVQVQDKSGFTYEANLVVDCVVKGQNMGYLDSDDIANQVTQLINSNANPDGSPDLQIAGTMVESVTNLTGINPTDNIFRTLIRYSFKITQL